MTGTRSPELKCERLPELLQVFIELVSRLLSRSHVWLRLACQSLPEIQVYHPNLFSWFVAMIGYGHKYMITIMVLIQNPDFYSALCSIKSAHAYESIFLLGSSLSDFLQIILHKFSSAFFVDGTGIQHDSKGIQLGLRGVDAKYNLIKSLLPLFPLR